MNPYASSYDNFWSTSENDFFDVLTSVPRKMIRFVILFGQKAASFIEDDLVAIGEELDIRSVYVRGYQALNHVVKSFSATINVSDDGEYWATMAAAGITAAGKTEGSAIRSLKYYLIELYDLYKGAQKLGPEPKRQLSVLERYIG